MKNWLEKNKIFFSVLFAITAVIVAYAQYRMMDKQNKISIANALPQITVRITCEKNEHGNCTAEQLIVQNEGGIIKEIKPFVALFVRAYYIAKKRPKITPLPFNIPLDGYYIDQSITGTGKGIIARAFGKDNGAKFRNFSLYFKKIMKGDNDILVAMVDIVRIVKITYVDIFGQSRSDYLFVDPIGGSQSLSQYEGERIIAAYTKALKNSKSLNFNKLNAEEFHDKIKTDFFDDWSIEFDKNKYLVN